MRQRERQNKIKYDSEFEVKENQSPQTDRFANERNLNKSSERAHSSNSGPKGKRWEQLYELVGNNNLE